MAKFRFQDLEIWEDSMNVANKLIDIADELERSKSFKFAEQLRSAALSISNNIAEGSGSFSKKDFAHFLNIARRSAFENANIVMLLQRRQIINDGETDELLDKLDHLCAKITKFRKKLQ
jgi:four helix bundle protein